MNAHVETTAGDQQGLVPISHVIVAGGRHFTDLELITADLTTLHRLSVGHGVPVTRLAEYTFEAPGPAMIVAHGGNGIRCLGKPRISADALAHRAGFELLCSGLWIQTRAYEVDPAVDGDDRQAAPRKRNSRMVAAVLAAASPGATIGMAYPDPASTGTWHCAEEMARRGVPVVVWTAARGALRQMSVRWPLNRLLIDNSRPRAAILPGPTESHAAYAVAILTALRRPT